MFRCYCGCSACRLVYFLRLLLCPVKQYQFSYAQNTRHHGDGSGRETRLLVVMVIFAVVLPPPFSHAFIFVVFPPVNSDETRGDEEQVGIGRLEVGEDRDGGGDVALRFFEGRPFQVNVGLLLQMDPASALVDGSCRVHAVLL